MAVRNLDTSTAFYQDFWCLEIVHAQGEAQDRVVWMTQPGKANDFIFVFMTGDVCPPQEPRDFSHFGFALESRDAIDALAERGRLSQNLICKLVRTGVMSKTPSDASLQSLVEQRKSR